MKDAIKQLTCVQNINININLVKQILYNLIKNSEKTH